MAKTSIMPTWAADVAALWGVQAHAQSVPFGHLAPVPGSAQAGQSSGSRPHSRSIGTAHAQTDVVLSGWLLQLA